MLAPYQAAAEFAISRSVAEAPLVIAARRSSRPGRPSCIDSPARHDLFGVTSESPARSALDAAAGANQKLLQPERASARCFKTGSAGAGSKPRRRLRRK